MENGDRNALLKRIQELEEQLHYYKDYDLLTGLYSKQVFYQKIEKILSLHKDVPFQIISVDIEHFKLINDFYGTEQGDTLLKYLAKQLLSQMSCPNSCFSRLGADIFAVFLPSDNGGQAAADKIIQFFHEYPLDMEIVPAIGIYEITDRTMNVNLMCDRSIMAANSTKGFYSNHAAWYDDSMRNVLIEEQELLNNVDLSLKQREFEVFMQPKCNMNTGKITGAEALVRWNHPQKGMIPPNNFIPIFEKNGFIKTLDQYIWEETAAWLHRWYKAGHRPIPISVNISRIDVFGLDVCQIFSDLATKYELDPSWLELEITESAYSSRTDEIILVINRLMRHGFTVLMDDFGSGYSSLNILKDISIDVLKLDMRFLDSNHRKSRDILESVVHMAKWLNLKVIAEGVENEDQIRFLLEIGCTYAQGFYYYRPMPISEFEELLKDPEKIDHSVYSPDSVDSDKQIHFKDLFYEDSMSEHLLNNILGAVAIYSYDGQNLQVMRGNDQYFRLLHSQDKESLDPDLNVISLIHPEDRGNFHEALESARKAGDAGAHITLRHYLAKKIIWLRIHLFFLSEINERNVFYASITDATHYMEAMEGLRISERRFRIAMESSNDTIFELDIPAKTAYYTPRSQMNFGLSDCVASAPEDFIKQGTVCPEYEAVFRSMYDKIYQGEEKASCIIQARMGDGGIVWNKITLTAIKDHTGKSVKAVGLVQNVTKEKELELQLAQKCAT